MSKKLLELRKKMNKKRPSFNREDYNKWKRIKKGTWRKPKGIHSKSRHSFKGNFPLVKPGYRGPKLVRGLHFSGLVPVVVYNLKELSVVDPKTQGVVIGSVGMRKRVALLNECKSKGINVLNFKDIDAALKACDELIVKKKEFKEAKKKAKKLSKEKIKKKAEEKKAKAESEEDKKEKERKDMEKILTKRVE
ncbi:50S ribosomal protein L32e [Candidatus Woesearchaeota archaeon]|nr:MAG: 50S ribosomal protein L32e [Candidatus Woesearchaeota archaeon]